MRDRIKVSTIARRRKSTSCSDYGRTHPSGSTLFFPFRGPKIGAHHNGFQFVVTARHLVFESADTLLISWQGNWQHFPTELIGHCEGDTDISVLRTDLAIHKKLNPDCRNIDTENDLILGEEVLFFGFPLGISTFASNGRHSVALVKKGIVSGFSGGPLTYKRGSILVDGHNNPGFSGGPLVSIRYNNFKIAGVISAYVNSYQDVFDKNAIEKDGKRKVIGFTFENSGIVVAHNIQSALDLMSQHSA